MKNEVIIQKAHHSCYDNQLTDVGIKLIDVETPADIPRAVNSKTALMFFMNMAEPSGKISREEWVNRARRLDIPTLLDAAADVPPVSRISEYTKLGFDLVAVSGGKAMCGPNDTGLLLGRKDLIEAAKLNANPHCGTIGRMMKVGKEDMVALWAAVEWFVKHDYEADCREIARRLEVIATAVRELQSVQCEVIMPPVANHVPHLQIIWDEKRLPIKREEVTRQLAADDPPIRIGRVPGTGDKGILVSALTLQKDEEQIVARRLGEILKKAAP
jgi:L-seryl-tRNA(Ser) seleniumtransferase